MYRLPLYYHVYPVNFVVTCDSCLSVSKTSFQCNHLNIPVYPIQVWVYKLYTPLLYLHVWTFQAFNSPFSKQLWNNWTRLKIYMGQTISKVTCSCIPYKRLNMQFRLLWMQLLYMCICLTAVKRKKSAVIKYCAVTARNSYNTLQTYNFYCTVCWNMTYMHKVLGIKKVDKQNIYTNANFQWNQHSPQWSIKLLNLYVHQ